MNPTLLKLTAEIAEVMRAHIKSFNVEKDIEGLTYEAILAGADEKAKKVQTDNGTFDVIISVESLDRAGEIVKQDGWDLNNYKNNPIVLWGHDYYSLGIGVCLEQYNTTFRGMPALGARGVFYSADINPLAQQVRRMYDFGLKLGVGAGCTTSVGFIPKEFDANDQSVITRAELLEFSFVPVPAQQDVGPAQGRMLTIDEAKELGLDMFAMRAKGLEFTEKKAEVKVDQAGDACEMDDGSPGVLSGDPLVCVPEATKEADTVVPAEEEKASVAGELAESQERQQKYQKVNAVWDIFDAFINAYLDDTTPVADFTKLLDETVALMRSLDQKSATGLIKEYLDGTKEKVGAKLSAATKVKIKDAHDLCMKGMEILKALHGNIQGEDGAGDGDEPAAKTVDGHDASGEDKELASFIRTRDLARLLAGSLNESLSESRNILRDYHRGK
jgi:hypothetical protein